MPAPILANHRGVKVKPTIVSSAFFSISLNGTLSPAFVTVVTIPARLER